MTDKHTRDGTFSFRTCQEVHRTYLNPHSSFFSSRLPWSFACIGMQRADGSSRGRGFTVSHQKVALDLAFSTKTIAQGYTELIIQPTDKSLRTIHLNSRQARKFHVSW